MQVTQRLPRDSVSMQSPMENSTLLTPGHLWQFRPVEGRT